MISNTRRAPEADLIRHFFQTGVCSKLAKITNMRKFAQIYLKKGLFYKKTL